VATPAHLIVLAFGLGCINALDVPARQAIVVQLVDDKADLPNAIALNSFMMHATRFVGPALAGWVVATTGEALCFLLNAASYLAVLLALLAIRLPAGTGTRPSARRCRPCAKASPTPPAPGDPRLAAADRQPEPAGHALHGADAAVREGDLRRRRAPVRPADGLRRRGAVGRGAAGAAPTPPASARWWAAPRRWWAWRWRCSPAVRQPVAERAGLVVLGFAILLCVAGSNTLIQTAVDNDFRGRVMALFTMAFLGLAPSAASRWAARPRLRGAPDAGGVRAGELRGRAHLPAQPAGRSGGRLD
jgi:hypothetical protein